jgi:cytochrome P450
MGVILNFADADFLDDPYPTYAALRGEAGVSPQSTALGEMYPVTRYEEVEFVLRNPEIFSSRAMNLPGQQGSDTSLIGQDPPIHTRQRNIINRGFTPRRVAALEARVVERVEELFAGFEGQEKIDLVEELAAPLPVIVIAELLGLDPGRHREFKAWADAMIVGATAPGSGGEPGESLAASLDAFRANLLGAIEARRKQPEDDLISILVHAEEEGGVLNSNQLLNFVQLLVAAGSETTTNLLGTAVQQLASDPVLQKRVREDLSLIPALIDETLRFDSPVQMVMRRTERETEIAGTKLPFDALVFAIVGSANRDSAHFPDPDRFDIDRSTAGFLSFGLGAHFCLGSSLARLEARIALEAVLTRWSRIELATPSIEKLRSFLVRGPRALPLTVEWQGN